MNTYIRQEVLLIIMVLFTAQWAQGDVLYVDSEAFGGECTDVTPCARIQSAVDLAVPGDVISIKAGVYTENILINTSDITLVGASRNETIIVSAGGREGAVGNAGNPLNAVIEVKAPNVRLTKISVVIPDGDAVKRDAGVFAWAGSDNLSITHSRFERNRDMRIDEPTVPGSRGVFVLLSRGSEVLHNQFYGNYEDHVHLPSGGVKVSHNLMVGAARAGVSVMSPDFIPDFPSDNNIISHNTIMSSIDSGVHIQGDENIIEFNRIGGNGGYGVYLCGSGDSGCYPPGTNAVSEHNVVRHNQIKRNAAGEIGDFGVGNNID